MTYAEWIDSYVAREGRKILGMCAAATTAMAEAFPELKRVPGHVYCEWGRRAHWWCEAPDGTIVDPTAEQFPGGVVDYEPWKPGSEVRVGRCMDCGEDIYATPEHLDQPARDVYSTQFCNAQCAENMTKAVGW